jgi:subfamily B ATP-binding cassette protein HlyB/CyaB
MRTDSGVACLVLLARYHGLAASSAQLLHQIAPEAAGEVCERDLLRSGSALGLKLRAIDTDVQRLSDTPLPAIARHVDGHYFIIAAVNGERILIQDPLEQRPLSLSLDSLESAWSGRLILATRRPAWRTSASRFGFSWFLSAMAKYRRLFGEVLLASFFLQLFALMTPLFFQVVIDKVLQHRGLTTLDVLALGLLVLSVFEIVLGGLRSYLFSHTSHRIDVTLGARLFGHLLHLPLAYFEARRIGDTVARARELENIRGFLTGSALTLVIDLFFTLVFFAVLYLYSPLLTAVVAGAVPFYLLLSVLVTPLLRARLEEKFNRGAENQAFLVESVGGIETVKSMAVEPQMQRRWEDQLAAYVAASFKAMNLGNIASQCASLINKVTVVLILWIGARLVIDGALSVGQLIAFNMIAARISGPILRLVQLWQDFQQAGISVRRLGDILNTPAEPGYKPGRESIAELAGRVVFERVGFRYAPDQSLALHDVSIEAEAGEVIGVVGRSGSGKSTLVKLIQRLYVPEAGRVLIDGTDLALVDTAWLRRQVGVVMQESFLFNRSVRENIALADPAAGLDRVIEAAQLAGAHEFILRLPHGYDSVLEEQGANLSGGQRQRIAIARALVTDPRILILDEATSALDYESESIIQENMRRICRNRTVFIVAHRLSAMRLADRLIVMDRGHIAEQGSHAELMRRRGIYRHLFDLQSATFVHAADESSGGERLVAQGGEG